MKISLGKPGLNRANKCQIKVKGLNIIYNNFFQKESVMHE